MGLDVYLYRYEDLDLSVRLNEEYERRSDAVWEEAMRGRKLEAVPESEREAARLRCEEIKRELGVDDAAPERVELKPKTKLPKDHIFRLGYFRSSYNPSGINRVLRVMGVSDLNEIFGTDGKEYRLRPDWRACLDRVDAAIEKFKYSRSGFSADEMMMFEPCGDVTDDASAVAKFKEEMSKNKSFGSYSNVNGHFFVDNPLRVRAIILGRGYGGRPAVYAVFDVEDDYYEWYLKALMVVRETIQYVLKQKDPEKYVLHWSG